MEVGKKACRYNLRISIVVMLYLPPFEDTPYHKRATWLDTE
jgi:hypothetical protein